MEKKRIRVLSYNIHKGFNFGRGKFILNKIRESIREVHPDLVFLQEVLGQHEGHRLKIKNWPIQPQFEFLAQELWPHFAYGKNAVYTSGHHGNAILSKHPFILFENIDISTNQLEKRGLLHGIIDVPGRKKPMHAICVHLGLFESERFSQLKQICTRLDSHVPHDEPLILGGDFNDWRGRISTSFEARLGIKEVFYAKYGTHARTFPSWYPTLKLDRIYCRGFEIKSAECLARPPWSVLSDHAPLMTELNLE